MVGHASGYLVRIPTLALENESARSPSEVKEITFVTASWGDP